MKVPINSYHSIPKPLYRESITFATFPAKKPNLGTILQEELHSAIDLYRRIVSWSESSPLLPQEASEHHFPSSESSNGLEYWKGYGLKHSEVSDSKLETYSNAFYTRQAKATKGVFIASTGSKIGNSSSPVSVIFDTKSLFLSQKHSNQLVENNIPELPNARSSPDELNVEELTPPDLVREFKFRGFKCKSRRRFQMRMEVVRPQNHEIEE